MKNLTDFRKTVETGVDPHLGCQVQSNQSKAIIFLNINQRLFDFTFYLTKGKMAPIHPHCQT